MQRTCGGLTGANARRDWPQIEFEARAMEQAGYRRWEIHEELGVSTTWLRKVLGVSDRHRGASHPERNRRLVEHMHWQGLTLGQIALYSKIPKSTCHEWLSRLPHV